MASRGSPGVAPLQQEMRSHRRTTGTYLQNCRGALGRHDSQARVSYRTILVTPDYPLSVLHHHPNCFICLVAYIESVGVTKTQRISPDSFYIDSHLSGFPEREQRIGRPGFPEHLLTGTETVSLVKRPRSPRMPGCSIAHTGAKTKAQGCVPPD